MARYKMVNNERIRFTTVEETVDGTIQMFGIL
jgi:hypothetical protein